MMIDRCVREIIYMRNGRRARGMATNNKSEDMADYPAKEELSALTDWLKSNAGRAALEEAVSKARLEINRINSEIRVSPDQLNRQMTI